MKINREKSNKMKKIIALSLAAGIFVGNGVTMYSIAHADESNIKHMKQHREYLRNKRKYYENVKNASLDEFDSDLINLSKNGKIIIRDIEYKLSDLYITYGNLNNERTVYLLDYKNPSIDIFSGNQVDSSFTREKIMLWIYSESFYHFYLLNKSDEVIVISENNYNDFARSVLNFNAIMHKEVPETYYYSNSSSSKIK